jgi:hypothetical protein
MLRRTNMPAKAKAKRTLSSQEDRDSVLATSPAKRLRTEDSKVNVLNGDAPAPAESPVAMDEDEDEPVELVPAPVFDDLYLDTVYPLLM